MTLYSHEPLDLCAQVDLIHEISDSRNTFYSVTPDDHRYDYPNVYADSERVAYELVHDLNTLALVTAEVNRPGSTRASLRAILGIKPAEINFAALSESVYVEDE